MLRTLVVALLLANVAFFAWTQGWLDAMVGATAHAEREPQRLGQQVRPEAVRLLLQAGQDRQLQPFGDDRVVFVLRVVDERVQ